jgi:Mn-dependent DtxR family transcriptional regulator
MAIGIDEEKASDEACRIEHVIDDETYEKINDCYDSYLSTYQAGK